MAARSKLDHDVLAWAERPQNRHLLHDEAVLGIEAALREGALRTGATLVNLNGLGLWHSCQAYLRESRGLEASSELYAAHCAALAEIRLGARLFHDAQGRRQSFRLWRSETALHCARAYACCLWDDAREMYAILRSSWEEGLFNPEGSFAATFVLCLLGPVLGEKTPLAREMPEAYSRLLQEAGSDNPHSTGQRLIEALEFRVERALSGTPASGVPELGSAYYAAYPAELLCVLRMRLVHGLGAIAETTSGALGGKVRLCSLEKRPTPQPLLAAVLREA